MKQGTAIALLFGLALAWAGMAHDAEGNPYPPPKSCKQWCVKSQCQCVEACRAAGHDEPFAQGNCKGNCKDERDACEFSCGIPKLSVGPRTVE